MPMLREGTRSVASIPKEVELMIRRLRSVFVISLMTVPFALPTSAGAQTCAPTDLTCTVDRVGGAAQDIANDPAGTAQDGVDAGQDAVGAAQGAAKDAVGTVRNTIDQVLGDGGITPPTGGGDGGHGGAGNGDGPRGSNGSGHKPQGVGAPRPAGSAASGGPISASPTGGDQPGVAAVDPWSHPIDHASSPTIGPVAAGVIGGVALMAVLLGAVVAFLAFQDRIDRRDPKLAMAAVGSDRVSFA
jgi:hypothetical protein